MKRLVPSLLAVSVVLSACGQNAAPNYESLRPAPISSQASQQDLDVAVQRMQTTVNNPSFQDSPQVVAVTEAMNALTGTSSSPPAQASVTRFAQSFTQLVRQPTAANLGALTHVSSDTEHLPTGTYVMTDTGPSRIDTAPVDGYVMQDSTATYKLTFDWRADGAPYATLTYPGRTVGATKVLAPTKASMVLTKNGTTLMQGTWSAAYGQCALISGPDSLNVSLSVPGAVTATAAYAVSASALNMKLDADYTSGAHAASVLLETKVTGSITRRCDTTDPATIKPSSLDVVAKVALDADSFVAELHGRELSAITLDSQTLQVSVDRLDAMFGGMKGLVAGRIAYNDKNIATAYGQLADGPDEGVLPGDQVEVQYLDGNNQVVTKTLAELLIPSTP